MLILLYLFIFLFTNSAYGLQEYVARRDFINGFKSGELTIYDKSEKHTHYRIESNYGLLHNVKLISYPSKEVLGRLKSKLNLLKYKAKFSILEPKSNKWINGSIEQNFQWFGSSFNIQWDNYRMSMKQDAASYTTKFLDQNNSELLAEFRLRPASVLWAKKYDLKIYSKKYPEAIYLLGLTVRDHLLSAKKG